MIETIRSFAFDNYFSVVGIGIAILFLYQLERYYRYYQRHSTGLFESGRREMRSSISYGFLFGAMACFFWPLSYTMVLLVLIVKVVKIAFDFLLRKIVGE